MNGDHKDNKKMNNYQNYYEKDKVGWLTVLVFAAQALVIAIGWADIQRQCLPHWSIVAVDCSQL